MASIFSFNLMSELYRSA
ncbi:hypothetical protein [Paenibacillus amylolyticus]